MAIELTEEEKTANLELALENCISEIKVWLPDTDLDDEKLRQERVLLEIEDKLRELWKMEGNRNW